MVVDNQGEGRGTLNISSGDYPHREGDFFVNVHFRTSESDIVLISVYQIYKSIMFQVGELYVLAFK